LAQIKAGMDSIKNNPFNEVATQLTIMATMTAPLRNSLNSMMGEPSRLAGTFESSMKNIQAITGLTSAEIQSLGTELNKIGSKSGAGPLAVADAYTDVAGGITKVAAQMPVLQNALALAEAGQADLGVATNGLVKIMNSYNFTVGDVAEINERAAWASDVMTQAVGMGVGSMNEFVTAMAPISGMAASVGVGFDEVGSTMAYMTATTDTAATAGTKLQSFIAALQRPNDDLAQALAAIGITSGSAMLAEYGLAASAQIVSDAFAGDQDAIAQAMGRMEAMKAVVSLTGSTYKDFAGEFGATMSGITASAQAVQTQAYESKVARLQAASSSLKVTTGQDINTIKGFFVDMGAGFLAHVVNPIMSSPVGGVFRGISAVVGLTAQGLLSLGGGALNAAAQFSVLAANIKNAGGYSQMLKGAMQVLGVPFKAVGSGITRLVGFLVTHIGTMITHTGTTIAATAATAGYTGAMWASVAATWAAVWPVLAVVAAVALVAGGAYLIIKNWSKITGFFVNLWKKITGAFSAAWNWIKNLLNRTPNWVLVAVAAFFPIIGIPALIIKNWSKITGFFSWIWQQVTGAFSAAWDGIKNLFSRLPNWVIGALAILFPFVSIPILIKKNWGKISDFFVGLWNKITGAFSAAWGKTLSFFSFVWDSIVSIAGRVATWFASVGQAIGESFAMVWGKILSFFSSVWDGIVSIVASVATWFGSVWESVSGTFGGVWTWILDLFTSIWESIKGVVLGFVEWLSPVIDAILAPFRWLGETIGGILDTVGGWFREEDGSTDLAQSVTADLSQTVNRNVVTTTDMAGVTPPPAGTTTSTISPPSFAGQVVPPPGFTGTGAQYPAPEFSNAATIPAAFSPLMQAPAFATPVSQTFSSFAVPQQTGGLDLAYPASSAFSDALSGTIAPDIDMSALERQVEMTLQHVVLPQAPTIQAPWQRPAAAQPKQGGPISVNVQHLTVQAKEMAEAVNFYNLIMSLAHEEACV
jgi:TP901 family phage tail tape measure protein